MSDTYDDFTGAQLLGALRRNLGIEADEASLILSNLRDPAAFLTAFDALADDEEPAEEDTDDHRSIYDKPEIENPFEELSDTMLHAMDSRLKYLNKRFPQSQIQGQYESLEQHRKSHYLKFGEVIPPDEFWDKYADEILGKGHKYVSRLEFVHGKQDPRSTAVGF